MGNYYSLYFTRNSTVVRLPVNPETLPESREGDNEEYNVLGLGPIVVPRIPKPRSLTISGYFPGLPSGNLVSLLNYHPPEYYINFFKSAMDDRVPILYTPVRMYETGIPFSTSDTGYYVLVEDFDTEEKGAETGDFYFELKLTEYRDYSANRVQVVEQSTDTDTGTTDTAAASVAAYSLGRAVRAATSSAASTSASGSAAVSVLSASVEPTRSIPPGQIVVGTSALLNGAYYFTADGGKPAVEASGLPVVVSRIVYGSRKDPYHVTDQSGTALGWCAKDALQVISS